MIKAAADIAALSPYALADMNVPAGQALVSLSQNESLRAPSPKALAAAAAALGSAHLYPDPDWTELRGALADLHGIPAADILVGSGSMELIAGIARAFCGAHGAVLAPAHAYPFFRSAALLARARFDTAPEADGTVSVDALLAAVTTRTRIVFVANPGNPTGTCLSRAELVRLRRALRGDILLVIDEAYGEFADHLGARVFDLVAGGDTVVLRTFSKAYGLAGLRVGWGLFPGAVAAQVRKVLAPNSVSVAAQAAASAALADQDYMRETCALTADVRERCAARLRQAGCDVPDSYTNFVLVRFASADAAHRADRALRAEGLVARAQAGAGLPHCLRITIGAAPVMDRAAAVLTRQGKGEPT